MTSATSYRLDESTNAGSTWTQIQDAAGTSASLTARATGTYTYRDGVDFVALLLVARRNIRGGETRVFDAHRPEGLRFTLSQPWSVLMLDDERVIHETTPIRPVDPGVDVRDPHRDTLVLTYRRGGFQDP